MKTIFNKLFVGLMLAVAACMGGCHEPDEVIDELDLDRVLSPLNFQVVLEENVNATFSWTVMSGVEAYSLQLVKEDGSVYRNETIPVPAEVQNTMTFAMAELPALTKYVARLQTLSNKEGVDDSKFAEVPFETGLEQLFLNDGVVADADVTATTAVMRWKPGANVTSLSVDNGVGEIVLDQAARESGVYTLTGLKTGTSYTVKLCNGEAVRGNCTFVASEKYDIAIAEKDAVSITIAWGAAEELDALRISPAAAGGESFSFSAEDKANRTFRIEGLKSLTEYTIKVFNGGVEHGTLATSTMGLTKAWDFTTWDLTTFSAETALNGMTFLANSGKEMYVSADAELGCNYLDLKGKSTVTAGVPSDRSLKFSVEGNGVISIDCYANGAGRNFSAYIEALGSSTDPVEAPVKANRGKIYIPCTGITQPTNIILWTSATINHVYSIEWTDGDEAPGQKAVALATPAVTIAPEQVTVGDDKSISLSWGAVENARDYTWKLDGVTDPEGNKVAVGGTVTGIAAEIPASVVKTLEPKSYVVSVVANPLSTYTYKSSAAGTATFVVNDLTLDTPVVKVDPSKIVAGTEKAVTVTWEAVNNAAKYEVSFNGAAPESVTATSYTIPAAAVKDLGEGEYTVSVVAVPDAAGFNRSEAGSAKITVTAPSTGGTALEWSNTFFETLTTKYGNGTEVTSDFTESGLTFIAGGGKCKFGTSKNSAGETAYRIQLGGTGNLTKCCLQFTVDCPGTLGLEAVSGSSSADRALIVCIDGTPISADGYAAPGAGAQKHSIDCFEAVNGSVITIYSKSSGVNVISVAWTPRN